MAKRTSNFTVASDGQRQRLGWIQTSAALTTLLACAGVYHSRTAQLHTTESLLSNAQQMLSEHEAVAGKLQAATTKLQQTRAKMTPSEAGRTHMVTVTPEPAGGVDCAQWLAIFDSLTNHTPDDCWIQSWQFSDNQLTLSGRAVTAQVIHDLARRMEQSLRQSDWQVMPPMVKPDESQLMHFDLTITVKRPTKPGHTRTTSTPIDLPALASHLPLGGGP